MTKYVKSTFFLFLLVNCIFFLSFMLMLLFWTVDAKMFPPSKVELISHSQDIRVGDTFDYTVKVERIRGGCEIKINRWVEQTNGGVIKLVRLAPTEIFLDSSEAGKTVFNHNQITLPTLTPGNWTYNQKTDYFCNTANVVFGPTAIAMPPMPFTVK